LGKLIWGITGAKPQAGPPASAGANAAASPETAQPSGSAGASSRAIVSRQIDQVPSVSTLARKSDPFGIRCLAGR
jgi:hypothetical protein